MLYGSFASTPYEHEGRPHGESCDCDTCEPRCLSCACRITSGVLCAGCIDARRQEAAAAESVALVDAFLGKPQEFETLARRCAAVDDAGPESDIALKVTR